MDLQHKISLEPELSRARFSERFLAYVIDGMLFIFGYYLTLHRVPYPEFFWRGLWLFLYILYQAVLNSGGRVSLGKALLGIRVADLEGGPLSFPRGFLRALGYFLSTLFFNLGYVWAFFHPKKRAWHDLLAGSQVLEGRSKSGVERVVILGTAWVVFGILGTLWVKENLLKLAPQDQQMVEQARQGLRAVAKLEEIHHQKYGVYTDDIARLAQMTGNVMEFKQELLKYVAPEGFEIQSDQNHFVISARARNSRRTRVTLSGS
ncbi:MAG: RDD family protein [Elusimicrobia bacterium]|nr:RDD family protein [Elusimicrobiota bacterium]